MIFAHYCMNVLSYVEDSVFYVDYFVTISFCNLSNPSIVKINSGKFTINDPGAKIIFAKVPVLDMPTTKIYACNNFCS